VLPDTDDPPSTKGADFRPALRPDPDAVIEWR
jgi:hypothetical protein